MICKGIKRFCKDYAKIENYDKAIADTTQTWQCHHRLETHNSDGERRLVNISSAELIALDMYYDRPPEELIFLTTVEHRRLHLKGKPSPCKGKHRSEETKRKIGAANKGKVRTVAMRAHWSTVRKGKKPSEETKKKISEALKGKSKLCFKGKHWKLVDGKRVWY